MKKILLDAYINLNLGDDLFLKILFDRYPNVKWILPKGGEKYKEIFSEYKNVIVKDDIFFKLKNKFKLKEKNTIFTRYDAGVFIGGSIFMQIDIWKKQFSDRREVIGSFFKKKKPYFIMGANFGPFKDESFVESYRSLLSECRDICFRDNYSKDLFSKMPNIRVAPDIVFQLKFNNDKKIKDSIGISIIDVSKKEYLKRYKENYINKIKDIVETGMKKNKKITFFSFCKNQGDLDAINEIIDIVSDKYKKDINIIEYDGNINKFLMEFSRMENIIGTRFHACILSQVFSQGLYPLIYSEKTYNVLHDIGLDEEYTRINCINDIDVNHIFDVISLNKIKNTHIFEESKNQFKELDKYVNAG